MARYFRCEEPSSNCLHARTRAVLKSDDGCPINDPDCAHYRRPVPLIEAMKERHPKALWGGGIALLAMVLIAVLVTTFVGGADWTTEHTVLQTELESLERRLDALDASLDPSSRTPLDPQAWSSLDRESRDLLQLVAQADAEDATTEINDFRARLAGLQEKAARLHSDAGPDAKNAGLRAAAQQLVRDYEILEERAEAHRNALSAANEEADEALTGLIEQIRQGMGEARVLAPPSAAPVAPVVLQHMERIRTTLEQARATIDRLASIPPPPFSQADAGLTIATSPELAESLLLPALQARFGGGSTIPANAKRWFLTSTDSEIAPGAFVTAEEENPYTPLIDGSVDLVISERTADEAIRSRFADTFDNADLDSRAFAEVVALDAVALLAHPNAPAVPVDMVGLSRGPWLAKAEDAALIQRLMSAAVPVEKVANPVQSLLLATDKRALALYHRCAVNLRAKYLPFKPATGVPALAPSPFSIGTEDYRLAFRILAASSPKSRLAARQFIDYLTSDQGQERIAAAGFVDLRLRHRRETVAPVILATLAKALDLESIASASRYSTNLRFATDQHELDIKAQADLGRLPRALARDFPNGRVVILGFTDDIGTAEYNYGLAVRRAKSIAGMLRRFKIEVAEAGLGERFPVDTNDTEQGRAHNRRAEVWVVEP